MQFFSGKVLANYKEALDILVLKIEKPKDFTFQPGQYVMLSLVVNGKEESKPFSIAISPTKEYLEFATKDTNSEFKKAWGSLNVGEEIKFSKPLGRFVLDETVPHSILISGGIGITPFRSMIEYAVDKKLNNQVTLLYSNKVAEDIPFLEELTKINTISKNVHVELTITRPESSKKKINAKTGRIDAQMIKACEKGNDSYYICGPPGMVQAMEKILIEMRIDARTIRKELFTGYS